MLWREICAHKIDALKPLSTMWLYKIGPLGSLSEVLCGESQVYQDWQSYKKRGDSRVHFLSACTVKEGHLETEGEDDFSKPENSPRQKPTPMITLLLAF